MLYDLVISEKGVLVCVVCVLCKKFVEDLEVKFVVYNFYVLFFFRDVFSRKWVWEKVCSDLVKLKRLDLFMSGFGFGGCVGIIKGSLFM